MRTIERRLAALERRRLPGVLILITDDGVCPTAYVCETGETLTEADALVKYAGRIRLVRRYERGSALPAVGAGVGAALTPGGTDGGTPDYMPTKCR